MLRKKLLIFVGLVLIIGAFSLAAPRPSEAAKVVPSIEILGTIKQNPYTWLANTCYSPIAGISIKLPVWINTPGEDLLSYRVTTTVPLSATPVQSYTKGKYYPFPANQQEVWGFGIPGMFNVPPNTMLSLRITTLSAPGGTETFWSEIHWNCTTGAYTIRNASDGRINADAVAGPVALYCDGNTLEVWWVDLYGDGYLAFTFSDFLAVEAGLTPFAINTLLKKFGSYELWFLTTGEFQVNADAGEGKTYAFVFNGCPYDGNGYNANIDPNE